MRRHKFFIFILFIALVSCKSECNKLQVEQCSNGSMEVVNKSISTHYKADTIVDFNAPKRITRNIKLCRDGRLLISAHDDIIFHNGHSFSKLNIKDGLTSWYAFDALEDRLGNIWIASDQSGVFRVDTVNNIVTNFNTNDGIGHRRNMCIYEDNAGNIWIGGQGGLSKYDGISFKNYTVDDGLTHNDINTIMEDSNGNYWIGTRGNACIFDGKRFIELKNNKGESFYNVWSIIEDESKDIWLIDSSGLWRYSNDTFEFSLPDVWKIYQDSKGFYWFTGMHKVGTSSLKRLATINDSNDGNSELKILQLDKMLFGMVEDNYGNMWIGGGDGVWSVNNESAIYYTGVQTVE